MAKPNLTPAQKHRRFMRQPIMPGAQLTRRQLKRQVRAAAKTKYGPLIGQQRREIGEAKTYQSDVGNYYTDYINQVQRQSDNVRAIGERAQGAIQNLQAGVTGLANTDLTSLNREATADAEARGATAGDLSQMASNAAAVRQALVGSFAAQQAATNAADQRYASNRANVVAPGQRIGALAMAAGRVREARQKLGDTMAAKGAYKQEVKGGLKADEAKQILARQALGLDIAKANADISANSPSAKNREKMAAEGAKYGYSYKDWRGLGSAGRSDVIRQSKSMGGTDVYTTGAFAGKTKSEINAMSPAERQKIVDRFRSSGKGKDGKGGGGGGDPLTKGQTAEGLTQLNQLKNLMTKAKKGDPFVAGHARQPAMGRYAAYQKVLDYAGSDLKHPALARAVADAVFDGHISAYTGRMLRSAGYNPREVARLLGVRTHSQYMKTTTGQNTSAYGKAAPQPQGHY